MSIRVYYKDTTITVEEGKPVVLSTSGKKMTEDITVVVPDGESASAYSKGYGAGYAKGATDGYTEGYDAGYAEGEASGGGGSDFPVVEFFSKTIEELDLTGITNLGSYAVYGQNELKKVHIPDVETIGMMAIGNCNKLEELTFPASLKSLAMTTVINCANLKTVTFEGKPGSINTMAFSNCSKVTTINVSWQPDEVAGKPWGLPSAANINYGYTKEE